MPFSMTYSGSFQSILMPAPPATACSWVFSHSVVAARAARTRSAKARRTRFRLEGGVLRRRARRRASCSVESFASLAMEEKAVEATF